MITSFAIQNFRGLERAQFQAGRWTILYGGNGAGKSTILDAMNLVSSFVTGTAAFRLFPWGVYALESQLHDAAEPGISFQVVHETHPGHAHMNERLVYATSFGLSENGSVHAVREGLTVDDVVALDVERHPQTLLLDPACVDGTAATEVIDRHRFCRRYRLEPRAIREPAPAEVHFIDKRGRGLPAALAFLAENDNVAHGRLLTDFLTLFPEIAAIESVDYGSAEIALEFTTSTGRQLNGAHLSDGQSLALGMLFLAHAPRGPQVLLLDEPEVTLTPIVVRDLLGMIDRAVSADRQILLSTHSPYVIQWGIANHQQVLQVRPDFGVRTWQESLRMQDIDAGTFHSDEDPITVVRCCALLETYLVG